MIRIFQHGDHIAIAKIFSGAVHEIASAVYTAEQCEAWASRVVDYDHWKKRCEIKRPFVALVGQEVAGFLELDPDGHIDCAYTSPKHKRKGIMTTLVKHAISSCHAFGIERISVDASLCIHPLFEKLGFQTIRENLVNLRGVELLNYKMELVESRVEGV